MDLALNNLQRLIRHKNPTNQSCFAQSGIQTCDCLQYVLLLSGHTSEYSTGFLRLLLFRFYKKVITEHSVKIKLSSNANHCTTIGNICIPNYSCPVKWGYRIHWLHLYRGVSPPPRWVSWIWHVTIWWWGSNNVGALGNAEYPFIAITPRSTLARSGSTW